MRAVATMIAMAGCLALVSQAPAGGQSAGEDWQTRMLSEITRMRAEFAEYFIEAQQVNIVLLERELHDVRERKKLLQDSERQRREQIAEVEHQLASAELEVEARPQLEAVRAHLIGPEADRLRNVETTLGQREAEIAALLGRERQRAQTLRERMLALSAK